MNTFRTPRSIGRATLVAVAVTAFLIGGSLTSVSLAQNGQYVPWAGSQQKTEGGAKAAVATYLSYLASGDADSATKMSDLRVEAGCDVFLSENVYSGAKEHISEVEIIEAVEGEDPDTYEISFEYVLQSVNFSEVIEASYQESEKRWSVEPMTRSLRFDRARLGGEYGIVSLSGVDVDLAANPSCDWQAYPAVYELAGPGHGLAVVDPVEIVMPFASFDDRKIDLGFDEEFVAAPSVLPMLQEGFEGFVNRCVTSEKLGFLFGRSSPDPSCKAFDAVLYQDDVEDLQVELVEYPVVTIGNMSSSGVTYSAVGGSMRLSFSAVEPYPAEGEDAGVRQNYKDEEFAVLSIPRVFYASFVDGELKMELEK